MPQRISKLEIRKTCNIAAIMTENSHDNLLPKLFTIRYTVSEKTQQGYCAINFKETSINFNGNFSPVLEKSSSFLNCN